MEEAPDYIVEVPPEAEQHYLEVLDYLYRYHSVESADEKSAELLSVAISLEQHPYRGRIEERLAFLGKEHRFLLYSYSHHHAIKIIYFIEEQSKTVYVTDFFPTPMHEQKIGKRNRL